MSTADSTGPRYEIADLGIGEVLNQGFKLFANHFGILLGISCIGLLPIGLINGAIAIFAMPVMPPNPTPQDSANFMQGLMWFYVYIIPGMMIQFLVALPLTHGALMHAIAKFYLGDRPRVGEAYGRAFSIYLRLLGTYLLLYLTFAATYMGSAIVLMTPGVILMNVVDPAVGGICIFVGVIGVLVLLAVVALWFGFAPYICVLEGTGGVSAMSRSKQLIGDNMLRGLALMIVIFVLMLAAVFSSALIPSQVAATIVQNISGVVSTVVSVAVYVVFYFSLRCQKENFDLELLSQQVGDGEPEVAHDSMWAESGRPEFDRPETADDSELDWDDDAEETL